MRLQGRVLAVDDDPDQLRFISIVLQGIGLEVEVASSGAEGIAKFQERRPDLIICDVRMPSMNGYEFCQTVRKSSVDNVPFLFCSTHGNIPMRLEGLRVGGDDYLVKPVSAQELQFRVQALLLRERKLLGVRRELEEDPGGSIVLTGTLGQVSFADLLQLNAFQERDCLSFHLEDLAGSKGEVIQVARELVHASLGLHLGAKAFFRLLGWQIGSITVTHASPPGVQTMSGSLSTWLLDGAVQLDEYRLHREKLMESGGCFRPAAGKSLSEWKLSPSLSGTLSLLECHSDLDELLDASLEPDAEVVRSLSELLRLGLIKAGPFS